MFVTKNQFYVFVAALAFGIISAIPYGIFCTVTKKNKVLKSLFDSLYFSGLVPLFVWYTYSLDFSNLRVYTLVGFFCGFVLYTKSFNDILAKWLVMCYNKTIKKSVDKLIGKFKVKKHARTKEKKHNNRHDRNGGIATRDTAVDFDFSVSVNIKQK